MRKLYTLIILVLVMIFAFTSNVRASIPGLPEDDFLCGDVNEDGLVNVLDIITTVNYIMGGNPSPFNQDAADVNADDVINVLDIIAMVNIIMQVQGIPCPCIPSVIYEGQTYNTVQIGEQCWFKENLNIGTMISGTSAGLQQTDNDTIEKYCYDDELLNCTIYGGLYEWSEAMQYVTVEGIQDICPTDWHLPTDEEWKILEGTVDSQYPIGDPEWDDIWWRGLDAGGNLKETGITHWFDPNTGATDQFGFTGLPGGLRSNIGLFDNIHLQGIFWSSTQGAYDNPWTRWLYSAYSSIVRIQGNQNEVGFSIRCLKGCWPQPTQAIAGPDQLNVPSTSTTLEGNTPTYGTGVWHIISGTGGTIADTTSPTSTFTGVADSTYSLTWTITTQCGSTVDIVVISFTGAMGQPCPGIPTVEYEGQTYNTVRIGTQCWLKENLNVGTMIVSDQGGQLQTDNGVIEKFCFINDLAFCETYGGLYEWNETMQYVLAEGAQGICPIGWHIPTYGEWGTLQELLGGQIGAGGKMKEAGTTHWHSPNTGATNESGFTGFGGGYRHYDGGGFVNNQYHGYFWSSYQGTNYLALGLTLSYGNARTNQSYYDKEHGFSVRCLKDN